MFFTDINGEYIKCNLQYGCCATIFKATIFKPKDKIEELNNSCHMKNLGELEKALETVNQIKLL